MPEPSGFLLIDKPTGITSRRALNVAQRRLGLRRAGHCGTLDPLASGILVLLSGRARRLQEFIGAWPKRYEGEITLGARSRTCDAEGPIEPVVPAPADPGLRAVREVAGAMTGEIVQVPPAFSAVRIDGERAWKRARAGRPEIPPARTVQVHGFEITAYRRLRAEFVVRCSRGTYVRSLARDLGETLGVGAYLSRLRRTHIGRLRARDGAAPEDAGPGALRGLDELLEDQPRLDVGADDVPALFQGRAISPDVALPENGPLFAWWNNRVLCRLKSLEGGDVRCDAWLTDAPGSVSAYDERRGEEPDS